MANNDDWTDDYYFGKETGAGTGFAGHAGNMAYLEEQRQKQAQANAAWWRQIHERENSRRQNETSQISDSTPPTYPRSVKSNPWSNVMATFGFLGGAGVMYAQPEPSLAAAIIVGLISAFIFGRFYRFIFATAFILIVLWLLFEGMK